MNQHLNFQQLCNESIEIPLHINGELFSFFSTKKFNLADYNQICFTLYPNKEFPMIINDKQMPELDDKNEPLRDYSDKEILEYNQKQALYRFAAQLKMVDCNIEEILDNDIDGVVKWLSSLPSSIYEKLEKTLNDIINKRFNYLQQQRKYQARMALAFTKADKEQFDLIKIKTKEKRDKLFVERDKIWEINPNADTRELDKEIKECEKILGLSDDGIATDYGVTENYILLELASKYPCITMDFLLRSFKNELSNEEEILLLLMKEKYNLECESQKRIQDKFDKQNKNKNGDGI